MRRNVISSCHERIHMREMMYYGQSLKPVWFGGHMYVLTIGLLTQVIRM